MPISENKKFFLGGFLVMVSVLILLTVFLSVNWRQLSRSSDKRELDAERVSLGNDHKEGLLYYEDLSSSAEGDKLFVIGQTLDGSSVVYVSIDFGATWEERVVTNNIDFYQISASSDGRKAVVLGQNAYNGQYILYISTDSGHSWKKKSTPWDEVLSVIYSPDGSKLIASIFDHDDKAGIYLSIDSGDSWSLVSQPPAEDYSFVVHASSYNGERLMATNWWRIGDDDYGSIIYTSTDGGSSWSERKTFLNMSISHLSSSSDGQVLVASVNSWDNNFSSIYVSADYGHTWEEKYNKEGGQFYKTTVSNNGAYLSIVDYGDLDNKGCIYTSNDGGANWDSRYCFSDKSFCSMASSDDGEKMIIAAGFDCYYEGGHLWTSADYGESWKKIMISDLDK